MCGPVSEELLTHFLAEPLLPEERLKGLCCGLQTRAFLFLRRGARSLGWGGSEDPMEVGKGKDILDDLIACPANGVTALKCSEDKVL